MFSQRRITAYHEAGHVVLSLLLGIKIRSARVRHRSGSVLYAPAAAQTRAALEDPSLRLLVDVSGIAAEARLQGVPVDAYYFKSKRARDDAAHDLEAAHLCLMAALDHCDYRTRQLLVLEAMIVADDACGTFWTVIERVALELLRHRRVPGSRLHSLGEAATTTSHPRNWFRLETLIERAATRTRAGDFRGVPMPTLHRLGF